MIFNLVISQGNLNIKRFRLFANKTSEDWINKSGMHSNLWRGWDQIVEYNNLIDKMSKSQEREDKLVILISNIIETYLKYERNAKYSNFGT